MPKRRTLPEYVQPDAPRGVLITRTTIERQFQPGPFRKNKVISEIGSAKSWFLTPSTTWDCLRDVYMYLAFTYESKWSNAKPIAKQPRQLTLQYILGIYREWLVDGLAIKPERSIEEVQKAIKLAEKRRRVIPRMLAYHRKYKDHYPDPNNTGKGTLKRTYAGDLSLIVDQASPIITKRLRYLKELLDDLKNKGTEKHTQLLLFEEQL